jgi:hypothetical protein
MSNIRNESVHGIRSLTESELNAVTGGGLDDLVVDVSLTMGPAGAAGPGVVPGALEVDGLLTQGSSSSIRWPGGGGSRGHAGGGGSWGN